MLNWCLSVPEACSCNRVGVKVEGAPSRSAVQALWPSCLPICGGAQPQQQADVSSSMNLAFAVLDPGRTGLMALCTGEVLWWRLTMIMESLVAQNIALCFLPGARFPPGSVLPDGAQFLWLGHRATSWASVGCHHSRLQGYLPTFWLRCVYQLRKVYDVCRHRVLLSNSTADMHISATNKDKTSS